MGYVGIAAIKILKMSSEKMAREGRLYSSDSVQGPL